MRSTDGFRNYCIVNPTAVCAVHQMKKILDVPFWSPDWGKIQMKQGKADGHCIFHYHFDYFFMNLCVPDHTFFSDFLSARLKLWFDKTDDFSIFPQTVFYRRKYFFQGNK